MAALQPIRIEYPQNKFKRDEPTGGGTGPANFTTAVQSMYNDVVWGNLPQDPDIDLPGFNVVEQNSCYRNSVVTMLLNLKPFVNFLDRVCSHWTGTNNSMTMLAGLSRTYWDATSTQQQRQTDIKKLVDDWFAHLRQTVPAPGDQSWNDVMDSHGDDPADAAEFSDYILERMAHGELLGNEANLLERLFKVKLVSRLAYECGCHEKVRQPFSNNDVNLWSLITGATGARENLSDLLSGRMYSINDAFKRDCPTCGARQILAHQYTKFKYLPEVLLVNISNVLGVAGTNSRIDIPESLDLSYLQDYQQTDGQGSNDAASCQYDLKAVINYTTNHYRCLVRRNDRWTVVNERAARIVQDVPTADFNQGRFRPRLVAYVRNQGAARPPTPQPQSPHRSPTPPSSPPTPPSPSTLPSPPPPFPPHLPSSSPPSTPSSVRSETSSTPSLPDPGTLNRGQLLQKLNDLGIAIGSGRSEQRLRTLYINYRDASQNDRLSMLLKAKVLQIAQAEGVPNITNQSTKAVIVSAIIAGRAGRRSSLSNSSSRSSSPTPDSSDEVMHLRSEVQRLQTENDNLRADKNILQTDHDNLQATVTQLSSNLRTAQGDLKVANDKIGDLKASLADAETQIASLAPPPPPQLERRILKVKITDMKDPDGHVNGYDVEHFPVDNYNPDNWQITNLWWKFVKFMPENGISDTDMRWKLVVFVTARDQDRAQDITYQYECGWAIISLGDFPEPKFDVELLSLDASQNVGSIPRRDGVVVIRSPPQMQTSQHEQGHEQSNEHEHEHEHEQEHEDEQYQLIDGNDVATRARTPVQARDAANSGTYGQAEGTTHETLIATSIHSSSNSGEDGEAADGWQLVAHHLAGAGDEAQNDNGGGPGQQQHRILYYDSGLDVGSALGSKRSSPDDDEDNDEMSSEELRVTPKLKKQKFSE